jgi:lanosterol synthase
MRLCLECITTVISKALLLRLDSCGISHSYQAIVESGLGAEQANRVSCVKALECLDQVQIKDNTMHFGNDYRHQSKGAWPFSTLAQSYTVSDCAAEGLKAVLYLRGHLE